ncbi:MAG TPA: GNAT family N-acetyltransferase [Lacipirellulaceae bacterium]|jgi:RimJ/RimL family protein N-acetyltransferase|nr:GNAT family N-acetyltransferase [Lacipirellulaceae bacterium]
MEPFSQIRTERLLLRPPSEADAAAIFQRYGQDAEVARYMSWRPHKSIDDRLTFLRRIVSDNAAGHSRGYLIFSSGAGTLLGSIGGAVEGHRMQFGYLLARDSWGKGIATEAATQFVATILGETKISRAQAYCDVDNCASAHVLEKAGLQLDGTLRRYLILPNLGRQPRDVLLYAKVRD